MAGAPYFLVVAVLVAAIAAAFDLRKRDTPGQGEIPNLATLGPLALAPFAHAIAGYTTGGFDAAIQAAGFSVLGAAACSIVPYALWRAGGMGGGDVKLLAALGALMRPLLGIEAEFYACLAAALFALAKLAYDGKLFRVLGNTVSLALNPFLPRDRRRRIDPEQMTWMRFGPGIFAGTAVTAFLHWRHP